MKNDLDVALQQFQVRARVLLVLFFLFFPPAGIHDNGWTGRRKGS
jgi:hypothetical protein